MFALSSCAGAGFHCTRKRTSKRRFSSMNEVSICLLLVAALLGFLALGLWVPMALLAMGWLGMVLFVDAPVGQIVATSMWGASASWTLSALPLFIWMGVILFKTRLSEQMFTGLAPWFRNVPGGLIHVNVDGGTLDASDIAFV